MKIIINLRCLNKFQYINSLAEAVNFGKCLQNNFDGGSGKINFKNCYD